LFNFKLNGRTLGFNTPLSFNKVYWSNYKGYDWIVKAYGSPFQSSVLLSFDITTTVYLRY